MARVALVVDDDPAVLELLAEMLGELGCEVITRQDATEALAALEQDQRIGLLLTDINMPGIADSRNERSDCDRALSQYWYRDAKLMGMAFPCYGSRSCRTIWPDW